MQDITERKQAEEDLRKQKEILQKIFDHVPIMISFIAKQCNSHPFSTDGTIRVVNDTVAYPAETLTSTIREVLKKSAQPNKELSLV